MKNFLPLIAPRLISLSKNKTIFHTETEKITVEAPRKLIQELIEFCNGKIAINTIIDALKREWDESSLLQLIKELQRKNVIINGSEAGEKLWEIVENPIGFTALTEMEKNHLVEKAKQRHKKGVCNNAFRITRKVYTPLLEGRRSVRSFSGEVPLQKIINMLWSSYGEIGNKGRRTVPSAGALYPLKIHIALLQQTDTFPPGIYRVHLASSQTVGLEIISTGLNYFLRSFADPIILEGAHGALVISGSFLINAEKYGSRSLLFITLEAGHAAQNFNLAAVGEGVGTVEIGGFKEKNLSTAIHLPENYHPLIVTVFGKENRATKKKNLVDKKIEVQWQLPSNDRYHPPFAIASARLSHELSWSHGRDASPKLAHTKAIAEAKEWTACGNIPKNLLQAKFADIQSAVHPKKIIEFHPLQYRFQGFPFKPFDENSVYAWTKGYDEISGSKIHVLADHVYFPYFPKTPYYCYANSSGVAAHPVRQEAIEKSTLELIERDSFMIAYLTRLKFPTIKEKSLPEAIVKRLKQLRKIGFKAWIKDHSLDLAPVAHVILQNKELNCTICASSSNFSIERAIDHALMEAEASVLVRIQNGPEEKVDPQEVKWPLDHGRLYEQKRYFHMADFLTYTKNETTLKESGKGVAKCWKELLERFYEKKWQLITIPLQLSQKYGGNGELHIIRSIVPGTVQMTFGFRQEPAGMERIYSIARRFGNCKISYKKLTKFPHPFA
jgi:thiazole/oxazole-forming peptide maturase SagD family component